jgi:hypothetical protein
MRRRALHLLGSLAVVLLVFLVLVRPWYLRWGTVPGEIRASLPGDEIVPNAVGQETRAITIAAPIERVWPWLAQIGQDRGGFYSYDLLENLVGCAMPTVDTLRPGAQAWRLGDKLWMYPSDKAGGIGFATLRTFLPGRALGFGTHVMGTAPTGPEDGSWAFILQPVTTGTTRLLIRGRGAPGRSLLGVSFDRAIFEPAHFVMERRMMLGIKELAEGLPRNRLRNHIQVALWILTFGLILASASMAVWGKRWPRSLVTFVGACFLFEYLTLVQPAVGLGALLVSALSGLILSAGTRRRI